MSPARVNEHNPCHPDELRLEEDPIRTTRRTTDGIVPPVSWVPGGGVLRRGTPIQNRGEERREREGGEGRAVLSLYTGEYCLPRNSAEQPVDGDGGRKRGGRESRE